MEAKLTNGDSLKTYPALTKEERRDWDKKMGRNYLSVGNFRKTTKERISFEFNIGQLGELRVIESKAKACEVYRDFKASKKEGKIDILEEILVVSGSIEVSFENTVYKLKKGQILVLDSINPTPGLSLKISDEAHIISVYMPLSLIKNWIPRIWRNLESRLISPPSKSAKMLGGYLKLLAEFAIETDKSSPIYQPKAIIPLILANLSMLVFALGDSEEEKPLKMKDIQLDQAKQYMLVHISNPDVSPKIIAKEMGISVRYLHWLFKQSDETVIKYLTRKRIDLAQLLLRSSSKSLYSVTEIAFMCGFNDSTHFSRRFKQQVGAPPSVFRAVNFTESIKN